MYKSVSDPRGIYKTLVVKENSSILCFYNLHVVVAVVVQWSTSFVNNITSLRRRSSSRVYICQLLVYLFFSYMYMYVYYTLNIIYTHSGVSRVIYFHILRRIPTTKTA